MADGESQQFRSIYRKAPEHLSDRIDVLKYLRQGPGLTAERIEGLDDALLKALCGSASRLDGYADRVIELIRLAFKTMDNDRYVTAIKSALGLIYWRDHPKGESLTERRDTYAKVADVSPRTILNYEDAGIELLAQQIDLARRAMLQSPSDVSAKVETLEAKVKQQAYAIAALEGYVYALMSTHPEATKVYPYYKLEDHDPRRDRDS